MLHHFSFNSPLTLVYGTISPYPFHSTAETETVWPSEVITTEMSHILSLSLSSLGKYIELYQLLFIFLNQSIQITTESTLQTFSMLSGTSLPRRYQVCPASSLTIALPATQVGARVELTYLVKLKVK